MGQSTEAWRIATGAGLFIYFFLVVFEPFRIHEITDIAYKHRLLAGYGLVTALGMLVAFLLLPKFLPTFYQEEHWTVGRQIFSVMLAVWLIGCGNFFYSVLALGTPIRWSAFLFFQGVTFLLGIFPVAIITLLQYNRHLKRNLLEAKVLSGALPQVPHPAPILVLKDDQGKTLMSLTADKFLYAMADDNYVDVYCLQDQKAVRQVLRYTLTKLEADCSPAVDIIRCHRKYMVNLSKVTNVEGNAQGLKLRVAVSENFIPVSRAMVEPIKRRLSDH
jgi:hypothetical protein